MVKITNHLEQNNNLINKKENNQMKNTSKKTIESVESKFMEHCLLNSLMKVIDKFVEEEARAKGVDVETLLSQYDEEGENSFEQPKKEKTSLFGGILEAYDEFYRCERRRRRKRNAKYTVKRGK